MTRLIPILIATIILAACKKDNDDNKPGGSLVGKWLLIESYNQGPSTCSCWKAVPEMSAYKIEFKKNGSFDIKLPMSYSSIACPGEYTVAGDSLVWTNGSCGPEPRPIVSHYFKLENDNTLLIKYNHIPNYYYEMRLKRVFSF